MLFSVLHQDIIAYKVPKGAVGSHMFHGPLGMDFRVGALNCHLTNSTSRNNVGFTHDLKLITVLKTVPILFKTSVSNHLKYQAYNIIIIIMLLFTGGSHLHAFVSPKCISCSLKRFQCAITHEEQSLLSYAACEMSRYPIGSASVWSNHVEWSPGGKNQLKSFKQQC